MIRIVLGAVWLITVSIYVHADKVSEDDITFYLSNNVYSYENFVTGNYTHLNLDPTKNVKIICHGWIDSVSTTWYTDAKEQYEIRGTANVIGVDWSPHSFTLYSIAVGRAESIGYYIALLITDMSANLNIPLSNFHLIGHSLGGHIVGFAGQHVQSMRGDKIGRITGLDPARPLFEGKSATERLSDDDALFVDIIHTDGGNQGYEASLGHIDYYPNGGKRQNGCGILVTSPCSHNRAPMYFYESINSDGFVAVACSSTDDFEKGTCDDNKTVIMGENVDQTSRGDFYLNTGASFPFALG